MWRKFGAFVTCVHISFKFGFKQPNYVVFVLLEIDLSVFLKSRINFGVITISTS